MIYTSEMLWEMKLDPDLVCRCDNCAYHFPPEVEREESWRVYCAAWNEHKERPYLCKRWGLKTGICLIQAPPWWDKKKGARRSERSEK